MSLAILFHFLRAQHVSDINISIIRSLQLFCWNTTLVVLFLVRCVLEFRCGWVGVVSVLQAEALLHPATRIPQNSVLIPLASCQQNCMTYTVAVCTVRNSWWWTGELSETCRVLLQKKIWEISASSWFYYKKIRRYQLFSTQLLPIKFMLS